MEYCSEKEIRGFVQKQRQKGFCGILKEKPQKVLKVKKKKKVVNTWVVTPVKRCRYRAGCKYGFKCKFRH